MSPSDADFVVVANNLRAKFTAQADGSGFAYLELYDADDSESYLLHEDELLALYAYLGQKLQADGLIPTKGNTCN